MKLSHLICSILALTMLLSFPGILYCEEEAVAKLQGEVSLDGQKFNINIVKVRLDQVQIKVGLAKDHVGTTENLDGMAKRDNAVAGINGSFFDAYTSNPIKNPHHTVITDGKIVHIGNVGTLCWLSDTGEVKMERMKLSIEGSINGSYSYPQRWYAYWINRYPTADTITIFTPFWGESTNLPDGIQVVVSKGVVTKIGRGSQKIPKDGFVIYFRNLYNKLHQKFAVGDNVEYRIQIKNGRDPTFLEKVREAVGAGPLLISGGKIVLDPAAEGFSSEKILSLSCGRSALGLTKDGYLLLVTTSGTVKQLAGIMKNLNCEYAMNLDGGASSALWYKGAYVTPPGREISNALLILKKTAATPGPIAASPAPPSPPVIKTPSVTPTPAATPAATSFPWSSPSIAASPRATEPPSRGKGGAAIYIAAASILLIMVLGVVTVTVLKRKREEPEQDEDKDESPPGDFNF